MKATHQRCASNAPRRHLALLSLLLMLLGTIPAPVQAADLPLLGGLSFLTGHHTGAGSFQIEWDLPPALIGQTDPTTIVSISGYPYRSPENHLAVRNSFTLAGRATMVLQELGPTGEPVAGQPAPVGFTVEVTNVATGVGQWRARVEVVPGAPSRLADPVATAGPNGAVSVTWSPPAHATAGPVDLVRLECVQLDAVVGRIDAVASSNRAGITCPPGGHLRIRGHNAAGWGSPSELPEPAHGLTVTTLSPTRAVADWEASGFDPATLHAPGRVIVAPSGTRRAWLDSPHNASHQLVVKRSNTDGLAISQAATWAVPPAAPTLTAVRSTGAGTAEITILPSELNRETSEPVSYEVLADGQLVCAVSGRTDPPTPLPCRTGPLTRVEGARFTAVAHSVGGTSVASPELVLAAAASQPLPPAGGSPSPQPSTAEPSPGTTAEPPQESPPAGGPRIALAASAARASVTVRFTPAGSPGRPWLLWLQRRVDGKWQTVAQRTTKAAATTFKYLPSGAYRGWSPAQHGYPAGASPILEYRASVAVVDVAVQSKSVLMKLAASGPPGTRLTRLMYTVSRRSPWTGKWVVIGRYRSAKPRSGSSHNRIVIRGTGAFRIQIPNQGRFIGYRSPDLQVP